MSQDQSPRPHVLFVDDDEAICRSIARGLERAGLEVMVARSGQAALDLIAKAKFDVIVTDQQMAGMRGTELIEKLLAVDPALGPRIILTSGDLDGANAAGAQSSGYRSIPKPYATAELALLIRAVVARLAPANLTAA